MDDILHLKTDNTGILDDITDSNCTVEHNIDRIVWNSRDEIRDI